jgi:hypothetical protein
MERRQEPAALVGMASQTGQGIAGQGDVQGAAGGGTTQGGTTASTAEEKGPESEGAEGANEYKTVRKTGSAYDLLLMLDGWY